MADVHRLVGLAAIAVAAVAAVWSAVLVLARRDAGRAYLTALGILVAIALVSALLGTPLLVAGPGPADALHLLYGAIAVVAIPIGIWLAVGRTPRRQSVILLVAVLVELGVTVRLLQTG